MQIEKFIETIFPSQNAQDAKLLVKGELSEADKKKAQEEAETRQDLYFMMCLMGAIVLVISFMMVCLLCICLIGGG